MNNDLQEVRFVNLRSSVSETRTYVPENLTATDLWLCNTRIASPISTTNAQELWRSLENQTSESLENEVFPLEISLENLFRDLKLL